jgi:hypothetical protein
VIPTILLVASVLGWLVRDLRGLAAGIVVGGLAWGAVVGVADGSGATFVAGSLLGLANAVVGAGVGAGARAVVRPAGPG